MAKDNFLPCLKITERWEGGYSNVADDPGGPTDKGITQSEYNEWRRAKKLGIAPVRLISNEDVLTIYRDEYWDKLGCEQFPIGLDLCLFDAGVNSGIFHAHVWFLKTYKGQPIPQLIA